MTTQTQLRSNTEAERLADALTKYLGGNTAIQAAAELRRLVSFNQQLIDEVARLQKREWVGLTDEEIQEAITKAVRERKLSWLGFKKDDQGEYTIPVLSLSDYQMARATEAKLKEKNHG